MSPVSYYVFEGYQMSLNKMKKLGDKIRLGIMFGFLALVAYVGLKPSF
jgi:hypothetical protein